MGGAIGIVVLLVWLFKSGSKSSEVSGIRIGGLFVAFVGVVTVSIGTGLLLEGQVQGGALAYAGAHLLVPSWLARRVYVPLGMWRAALSVTQLSLLHWQGARRAGGVLNGIRAAMRLAPGTAERRKAASWLAEKLARVRGNGGTAVVAVGLLHALQGDDEQARVVLTSCEDLDSRGLPAEALAMAREWRAVDAVSRRDWALVDDISQSPGRISPLTRLLGYAARRGSAAKFPGSSVIWLRWLVAPHRKATLRVMQRAFAPSTASSVVRTPSRRPPPPADADIAADIDIAGEADIAADIDIAGEADIAADVVYRHVQLHGRGEVGAPELSDVVKRWNEVYFSGVLAEVLRERGHALNATDVDAAVSRVFEVAGRDLVALARRHGVAPGDLGVEEGILRQVVVDEVTALEERVELLTDKLRDRVEAKHALALTSEWQEYLQIRAVYEQASRLGGKHIRHALFEKVHYPLSCLGAFLYNDRAEKNLGHGIFVWLLGESVAVGDDADIRLNQDNVNLGGV